MLKKYHFTIDFIVFSVYYFILLLLLVSHKITDARLLDWLFFYIPAFYILGHDKKIIKPLRLAPLKLTIIVIIGIFTGVSYIFGPLVNTWTSYVTLKWSIDNIFLGIAFALWSFVIYEHFILKRNIKISIQPTRILFFLIITLTLIGIVILLYFNQNSTILKAVQSDFSYFKYYAPMIFLPIVLVLLKFKDYSQSLLILSIITFPLLLIYELIGMLHYGHWVFIAKYIFMFNILGAVIPFEEIFFWIFLAPASAISYYIILTTKLQRKGRWVK